MVTSQAQVVAVPTLQLEEATTVVLTGEVQSTEVVTPVAYQADNGIAVKVFSGTGTSGTLEASGSTDDTGTYTTSLQAGVYSAEMSFPGYETTTASFSIAADEEIASQTIDLPVTAWYVTASGAGSYPAGWALTVNFCQEPAASCTAVAGVPSNAVTYTYVTDWLDSTKSLSLDASTTYGAQACETDGSLRACSPVFQQLIGAAAASVGVGNPTPLVLPAFTATTLTVPPEANEGSQSFTATVSPAPSGGSVTLTTTDTTTGGAGVKLIARGNPVLSSGSASCPVDFTAPGDYTLVASYSGGGTGDSPSVSAVDLVVVDASTTTTLSSSALEIDEGTQVTFSADS